ncbi:hypothetical protein AAFF_G00110950 [Aldrovandia affinis]|uniref:Uncharacterized protein n=1 Tax=Aldrovandia affinis TaxID=143900 RepID=A0AAD7RW43_9TELE|nr:hypothetical protein AAFF_G00110950 [Aldrovandia affinis]
MKSDHRESVRAVRSDTNTGCRLSIGPRGVWPSTAGRQAVISRRYHSHRVREGNRSWSHGSVDQVFLTLLTSLPLPDSLSPSSRWPSPRRDQGPSWGLAQRKSNSRSDRDAEHQGGRVLAGVEIARLDLEPFQTIGQPTGL